MIKHILAGLIIMGLGLAFLVHFALIAYYGSVRIQEPNALILWLEIAFLAAIFSYGCWYLIKAIAEPRGV